MILISEIEVEGTKVKFYDGIDLDIAMKHPTDGSNGFIYCFVDSWVSEVKKHQRSSKIDSILDEFEYKEFGSEDINNNYICIYQTNGDLEVVYNTIKENIQQKLGKPWFVTSGINRGNITTQRIT